MYLEAATLGTRGCLTTHYLLGMHAARDGATSYPRTTFYPRTADLLPAHYHLPGMLLEMELGITGGEEDGVNNEDVNPEDLYTKPEEVTLPLTPYPLP